MQETHIEAIERTIHKTNEWLRDIQARMGAVDRQHAYQALRATLHVLRDRLPLDEVAQFGAQLPALIRGIYYEGWTPAYTPARLRTLDEFLGAVAAEANQSALDPERAARAVLGVLAERVTRGEIADVAACLPAPIRDLFPLATA